MGGAEREGERDGARLGRCGRGRGREEAQERFSFQSGELVVIIRGKTSWILHMKARFYMVEEEGVGSEVDFGRIGRAGGPGEIVLFPPAKDAFPDDEADVRVVDPAAQGGFDRFPVYARTFNTRFFE